jgi:hypothetical protein
VTPPSRFSSVKLLLMPALLVSATAFAQDRGAAVAERLIRTMRWDQFVAQGAAALFLKTPDVASSAGQMEKQSLAILRCLERSDTTSVVRALSKVAAQELSKRDMDVALAFYASSAGKKQVRRELIEAQMDHGYRLAGASPALSDGESRRLERFRETPTYVKLKEIPTRLRENPGEIQKAVYMAGYLVVSDCLRTLGLPRD